MGDKAKRAPHAGLVGALVALAVLSLALGLAIARERAVTSTNWQFAASVIDGASQWVGRLVSAAGAFWALWSGAHTLWRKHVPSPTQALRGLVPQVLRLTGTPSLLSGALATVLAGTATILAVFLVLSEPPFLPPGSVLVVTPDDRPRNQPKYESFLYVADAAAGKVHVLNRDALWMREQAITVAAGLKPGTPTCLAVAPARNELYVVDSASDRVIVIDRLRDQTIIPVGRNPRFISVTTDQKKAYVSNEQPVPHGSISVIDLDTRTVVRRITGVNCPEGLAITPDGKRLYVASQCGAGRDPVFVVDTATDRVVATIPDAAVGLTPAVSPDGKAVYVARGNPGRITVFETIENRLVAELPFPDGVAAMAFTRDGERLIVASGRSVQVFGVQSSTRTHQSLESHVMPSRPAALATSGNARLYVWLPDVPQILPVGLARRDP